VFLTLVLECLVEPVLVVGLVVVLEFVRIDVQTGKS
jgi:hypothetical protein